MMGSEVGHSFFRIYSSEYIERNVRISSFSKVFTARLLQVQYDNVKVFEACGSLVTPFTGSFFKCVNLSDMSPACT